MLNNEVIEILAERLVLRVQKQNEEILKQMGNNIKLFRTLTPTQAQQLAQILKYGGSYNNILMKLQEMTKLTKKDIENIFHEVAKENYYFSKEFFEYRGIDFIPYEQNMALQEVVNAMANTTFRTFQNFSNTKYIGFIKTDIYGNKQFVDLQRAYFDLIDDAVTNVSMGKTTFDSEMYKILKDYGKNGVNTVYNQNNRVLRLDSAIRKNMQEALTSLSNNIQRQFGEMYGADGVEISVHENPAPDHEDVQGCQFSFEEFNNLQNGFDAEDYEGVLRTINLPPFTSHRPIGTNNCYHVTFNCILGVSKPLYSKEQLEDIKKRNKEGFEYKGKHYTNYQGTQIQRRLELEIRKTKDMQILAKESDNNILLAETQKRITALTNRYKEFSEISGLPTKMQRLRVVGYKRKAIKK